MLNNYVYKFLQKVLRLQEVITCYKIIGEFKTVAKDQNYFCCCCNNY